MKIGVFDSGKGGKAVARKLSELLPTAHIVCADDHMNVPYGAKTQEEIVRLTLKAVRPLIDLGCDSIVIACNTATMHAISALRAAYPTVHFVGLEPMIKPAAALTRSHTIAVLATPATLSSARYKELKMHYAAACTVYEPDCSSWAERIENGREEEIDLRATLSPLIKNGVDTIVLACTHYHWLEEAIQEITGPSITVLEPTDAIKERILTITDHS